jgi:hypothetical protein
MHCVRWFGPVDGQQATLRGCDIDWWMTEVGGPLEVGCTCGWTPDSPPLPMPPWRGLEERWTPEEIRAWVDNRISLWRTHAPSIATRHVNGESA